MVKVFFLFQVALPQWDDQHVTKNNSSTTAVEQMMVNIFPLLAVPWCKTVYIYNKQFPRPFTCYKRFYCTTSTLVFICKTKTTSNSSNRHYPQIMYIHCTLSTMYMHHTLSTSPVHKPNTVHPLYTIYKQCTSTIHYPHTIHLQVLYINQTLSTNYPSTKHYPHPTVTGVDRMLTSRHNYS